MVFVAGVLVYYGLPEGTRLYTSSKFIERRIVNRRERLIREFQLGHLNTNFLDLIIHTVLTELPSFSKDKYSFLYFE